MRKFFLLTLFLCSLLLCPAAQAAQVTDVKWGVDKNNVLRFVVDVTDTAGYAVDIDGSTLNLTVNASKGAQVQASRAVKSTLADKMQVVAAGNNTIVRVPLKQQITTKDCKVFVLRKDPQTGRPFRVVLDVTAARTATAAPGTTAAKTAGYAGTAAPTAAGGVVVSNHPVAGSTPAKSTAATSTTGVKAATAKTHATAAENNKNKLIKNKKNKEKAVISTKKPADDKKANNKKSDVKQTDSKKEVAAVKASSKFRTGGGIKGKNITLDAGHGGSDPGAIGASGLKEKDVTLPITQMVKELLEKKGATVHMTRTKDVDVCAPNASDKDELQARVNVAEKNNADIFVSLHVNASVNKSVGGFSTYYFPKTNNDLRLAQLIQNKLAANFGVDNLGVRQANFYVNKRSSMPSALLEMCFISNAKEEKLMRGNWFRKKAARLIAEAIEKYFE